MIVTLIVKLFFSTAVLNTSVSLEIYYQICIYSDSYSSKQISTILLWLMACNQIESSFHAKTFVIIISRFCDCIFMNENVINSWVMLSMLFMRSDVSLFVFSLCSLTILRSQSCAFDQSVGVLDRKIHLRITRPHMRASVPILVVLSDHLASTQRANAIPWLLVLIEIYRLPFQLSIFIFKLSGIYLE